MPPTVILIRHAQAVHNYSLHDPPLTDLGRQQCAKLATHLRTSSDPLFAQVSLIAVSPMLRTLETCQLALSHLHSRPEHPVPVICLAEWQENSAKPCDVGSEVEVFRKQFETFDWSQVDTVWPRKEGLYAYSRDGLTQRGIACRKWLRKQEGVVAVVSHSGFLRVGVSYKKYENADYRIFSFAPDDVDAELGGRLVEWELTEKNGGGLGKSPHGTFLMKPQDYGEQLEDVVEGKREDLGEATKEVPK
ncbi:histidine phosphatase superfamily [Bisporella sp. PMI_857]|nr:histidine phosphatase superfamily [Bisporella sp. PMI_857]